METARSPFLLGAHPQAGIDMELQRGWLRMSAVTARNLTEMRSTMRGVVQDATCHGWDSRQVSKVC